MTLGLFVVAIIFLFWFHCFLHKKKKIMATFTRAIHLTIILRDSANPTLTPNFTSRRTLTKSAPRRAPIPRTSTPRNAGFKDIWRRAVFQFSETENFNPKVLQQSAPTSSICLRHYARTVMILSENSLSSSSSLCSTTLH